MLRRCTRLCRAGATCVVLVALSIPVRGQTKGNGSTPGERSPASVVREYCRLDLEGARLSSNNPDSEKYFALVAWPDEPGWDGAIVIRNFAVTRSSSGQALAEVTVKYSVLGTLSGAAVTASPRHEESVTFTLKRSGSTWKIERPLISPHISVNAAIATLRGVLNGEKDPERRKRLSDGIAALSRLETRDTHAKP